MTGTIAYAPGPWLALVRNRHAVLLPGDTAPQDVERLWEALDGDPGVESLLSAVLSGRGLALTGMDPFGIVALTGDVHTILRGPLSLAAEGRELSTHVNGLGVTTWMERRIPNQEGLDVALDDVLRRHDGDAETWLPIVEGVVRFGRLHADLPAEDVGDIEPLSAPTPLVVAEPARAAANDAAAPDDAGPDGGRAAAGPAPSATGAVNATEPADAPAPVAEPAAEAGVPVPDGPARDREEPPAEPVSAGEADDSNTILSASALAPTRPDNDPHQASDDTIAGPHADDEPEAGAGEPATAPAADAPASGGSGDTASPGGAPAGAETASEDTALPDPELLIDAVPWLAAARAKASGGEPLPAPADDLPTIASAPRPASPSGVPGGGPAGPDSPLGDHDGNTVLRGDLPTEAIPVPAAAPAGPGPTATGPRVLGRLCADGHANPPVASSCALCGLPLVEDPQEVSRPSLGRMVISDGETVELDRPAVVGRQPTTGRAASGSMPRVVQVKSPNGDISRSHLEVQLEGWHVMLVDLKATNGTMLVRAGMPPRRIGQGEKLVLLDGDIADLGDGVSLRFEGLR